LGEAASRTVVSTNGPGGEPEVAAQKAAQYVNEVNWPAGLELRLGLVFGDISTRW